MRVSILTNGPGELWGWARPVAMELRRRGHSVSLWLLPCPFASGHEREAASLLGVDKLEGPMSASRLWQALAQEHTDCVLQLGGDLMFGNRLARRTRTPLFCYSYGPGKGMSRARVFTAWASTALTMPGAQPIGDLVRDALAMDSESFDWPEEEGAPRLLLCPGTRPAIRAAVLPWFLAVVERLRMTFPRLRPVTLFSPFIPEEESSVWRDAGLNPKRVGAGVAMRSADYALTQPGTNTLELMHCGLPGLVAAPFAFLDLVPIAGLRGFIASLPLVGRRVRMAAANRLLARHDGFISLPNRMARRSVLDELYGDISPDDIADRVSEALVDTEGLRAKRKELLSLSGPGPGAARTLCDALEQGWAKS
ncbi:MAG: hypothetical protein GX256_09130 [Fretibacterium sp.]|nr:hypothetical protein [Fretibacterium sp.]